MKSSFLAALLLLAACGSMEWRKDGSSQEATMNDWAACRRNAELRVPPDFPMPTGPIIGPSGVILSYPAPVPPSQRQADIMGMAQACMQDKGYQLKPVDK